MADVVAMNQTVSDDELRTRAYKVYAITDDLQPLVKIITDQTIAGKPNAKTLGDRAAVIMDVARDISQSAKAVESTGVPGIFDNTHNYNVAVLNKYLEKNPAANKSTSIMQREAIAGQASDMVDLNKDMGDMSVLDIIKKKFNLVTLVLLLIAIGLLALGLINITKSTLPYAKNSFK